MKGFINHADISVSENKIGQILKGLNSSSPDYYPYNQCFVLKYSIVIQARKKNGEKDKKGTGQKNPSMHIMPLLRG